MKFAKIVFWSAGAWGVLIVAPMLFLFDMVGSQDPPPINHPQFYYGFATAALVWQFVYMTIAANPARFRPFMLLGMLAKLSYFAAVAVLYAQGRLSTRMLLISSPDALFGALFLAAYLRTKALMYTSKSQEY